MPEDSQLKLITTALAQDILSTKYEIQTRWHAIAGAPSCGKTTLIGLLAGKGFNIVPEGAREYMEGEIASGRTVEEIRADGVGLQRSIHARQVEIEAELPPAESAFLDGALPEKLAWFRAFGLDPNEILPGCFRRRYASVFVLDRLPTDLDGIRFDDDALPEFLDEWIERDYKALGYDVIRVPILAPEARLAFILERLPDQDGI